MKKRILCLTLLLVLAFSAIFVAACNTEENKPVELTEEEKQNTVLDKPQDKTPAETTAVEALFVAQGELRRSGGFKTTTEGSTVSVGGITQNIVSERVVVGQNVFKQSASYSAFVKSAIQHYVYGENYLARDSVGVKSLTDIEWSNSATKYSESAWKEKVGYRAISMTGYILNENTVLSGTLESQTDGLYTFRYVLDTEKATAMMLYEMRDNANSDKFAVFTKAEIVVMMDDNFIIQTLETDCAYKATASGLSNIPCTEHLTETFFDIGYNGDLPQKMFFEQFFDANDVEKPEEKDDSAMDILTGMFDKYLTGGEKLYLAASATESSEQLLSADVALNLNLENLKNSAFDAKLGDMYISYNDQKVLIDYQDFKGSTTLLGLTKLLYAFGADADVNLDDIDIDAENLDLTYEVKNGKARVHLPLNVGVELRADFYANVHTDAVGGTSYEFYKATVSLGSAQVQFDLSESWQAPERTGEYSEISGLSNLVDDGKLTLKTKLMNSDFSVMTDLATQNVYAKTSGNNVSAAFTDDTLFVTFGKAKIKFALSDVEQAKETVSKLFNIDFDNVNVNATAILALLGNIQATTRDGKTVFSAQAEELGISAEIVLVPNNGEWNFENLTIRYNEETLTFTSASSFSEPKINESDYIDLSATAATFEPAFTSVAAAKNYEGNFEFAFSDETNNYSLCGDTLVNTDEEGIVSLAVNAVITENAVEILKLQTTVCDNTLYICANDIKYATNLDSSSSDLSDVAALASILPIPNSENAALNFVLEKYQLLAEKIARGFTLDELAYDVSSLTFQNNTLSLGLRGNILEIPSVTIALSTDGTTLTLSSKELKLNDVTISGKISASATTETVSAPNIDDYTTDIAEILSKFNYNLTFDGKIVFGTDEFKLDGTALIEGTTGKIHADIDLYYQGVKITNAKIWLSDGVLYCETDDANFAVNIENFGISAANDSSEELLLKLLKKNAYIDKLLTLFDSISQKIENNEIDYSQMVKSWTVGEDYVEFEIDGEQLGIGDFTLKATENGIFVSDLVYEDISAEGKLNAKITEESVTVPEHDWNTYFEVKVDSTHTLWAGWNFAAGIYNFKLQSDDTTIEPLFAVYTSADNTVKIKQGELKISADATNLSQAVAYMINIANGRGTTEEDVNAFVEKLIDGLSCELSADAEKQTVTLKIFSNDFVATVKTGDVATTAEMTYAEYSLTAKVCESWEFGDFSENGYVSLDEIAESYGKAAKALADTECWTADFNRDGQIDIVDAQNSATSYLISAGSYLKIYANGNKNDFLMRAKLMLKQKGEDGLWADFVTMEIAVIDGRIYLTYNQTLKATISLDAIENCEGMSEELLDAIPQIGINLAMSVAEGTQSDFADDYLDILKALSFENGELSVTLNGNAFSDRLGNIEMSLANDEKSLTLQNLTVTYGNITLTVNEVVVAPSGKVDETTDTTEQTSDVDNITASQNASREQYVAVKDILAYLTENGDESAHINFDTLQELLRAFIDTANNTTFAIDGVVTATLDLSITKIDVPLELHLRIDIDENDRSLVYVSALIVRENTQILGKNLFEDKGGYSYLNYNGKTGEFTVMRDSYKEFTEKQTVEEDYDYCSQCGDAASLKCYTPKWLGGYGHSDYISTEKRMVEKDVTVTKSVPLDYYAKMTTDEFLSTVEDQIFEMLNFGSPTVLGQTIDIEQLIRDSVASSQSTLSDNASEFTVTDFFANLQNIFKNYEYVTPENGEDNYFSVQLDLSPINSSFGILNLNIGHTISYTDVVVDGETMKIPDKLSLTYLKGDFTMASIVKLAIDLELNQMPTYGEGTDYVLNETHWGQSTQTA